MLSIKSLAFLSYWIFEKSGILLFSGKIKNCFVYKLKIKSQIEGILPENMHVYFDICSISVCLMISVNLNFPLIVEISVLVY